MISAFSQISIEVPELGTALDEYQKLLGEFHYLSTQSSLLALANTQIELREEPACETPRIASLTMVDESLADADTRKVEGNSRGLNLYLTGQAPVSNTSSSSTGIGAVDHLVVQTRDADDCIRLFGEDGLGIRLALDQEVPEWGGRMLFFRTGKMTLEVIQNLKDPVATDHFWGITYLCKDLDATVQHLDAGGIQHSAIRIGRKPGTRVATVKSHCLGLPTMLIEPSR